MKYQQKPTMDHHLQMKQIRISVGRACTVQNRIPVGFLIMSTIFSGFTQPEMLWPGKFHKFHGSHQSK